MCQHHIHIDQNNNGKCIVCGDKFKFKTFEELNYDKTGRYGSSNPNPVVPFYMISRSNIYDVVLRQVEQDYWN